MKDIEHALGLLMSSNVSLFFSPKYTFSELYAGETDKGFVLAETQPKSFSVGLGPVPKRFSDDIEAVAYELKQDTYDGVTCTTALLSLKPELVFAEH